ncbi:uncharacterized protein LOC121430937 [Lytechinus variegatus]|uniref:uncharacterized protein LOC121430937 n=1 Tax=Lytechinus variegatus TaxID=7654 RepID=UPI001BB1ED31|nr:uncharacterized protein LOC121430937 [Lytechinus variegatus]
MERGLDLRRLHVFLQSSLSLLLLCPARFSITAGSSTDQPCNVQPIHKCLINTYDMENNPTSTSAPPIITMSCPDYESNEDQEFYWASGDSCCPQNEVTAEVNLKPGMRTKIECSLVASDHDAITNPVIYEWTMQALEGYRIILTVVTHDVYNTFTATDEEGDSEFTFSTRSFFEVGDSFLSSSNVVHMEASLESLDSQFTVIGQVVNILNTFDITDDPQGCSDNGRNLWDTDTGCSDDSHRFEGSCYFFYSVGTDLNSARQMCEARTEGSHLVFIDNKEEQDFLASTSDDINQGSKDCSDDHDCDYWVGIERSNDGELTWMDGSQIIYEHFKKFDDDDECFRLKSEDDYVWESHNCNHRHYGYICEKENDCEQNSTTLPVYEPLYRYGGSCYYFHSNEPMGSNIDGATKACEGMEGFHLVYIEKAEEQTFLVSTSQMINRDEGRDCSMDHDCDYWIGLTRNSEDQLVWMDDSPITYKYFKAFDVDDECFRLKSEDDYAWESHDCTHDHYGYICEREVGYHGANQSDMGCITYKARPAVSRTTLTDTNDDILLMFRYYIKTFEESAGNNETVNLWTGNNIVYCKSSNVETIPQTRTSLKIDISCGVSSDQLVAKFQAKGKGLVKISDILFLVSEKTSPVGPQPTSTPLMTTRQSTTGATTSTSTSPRTKPLSTSLRPSSNPMTSLHRSSLSPTAHPSTLHISTTEFLGISRPSSGGHGVVISVVVVLIIVLIIALIGFLWYKKRRNSKDHQHPKGSNGNLQNPAFENDIGEQHEYAEFIDPEKKNASNRNSTSDAMQHYYSDLPCSASVTTNPAIYNEVGEQDYNTLFGGKERDDYHEYSQPDSKQSNPNAKDTPKESSYQELFEDGKRHPVAGANQLQRSLGMEQAVATSQSKVGERNSTGDHAYQDLRKDDVGYTSLQKSPEIGQKPATGDTDQELENSYQALHADSPEYFTLEPDETNTSPSQENLQNSTYQPLTQEPQYHDAGPEKGNTPTRKDATYQPLLTDVSNHVGSDSVSVNASKQGKNNPSDHPQQRLTASSSDGYASLVSTAEEEDEHEYESPKGRPTTSDYEDPINDEPYNHLQRKADQGPSSYQPQTRQTEDDYETPVNNYDSTSDTYQTLGNSQETSDGANEEYSHLQRHFGARPGDSPRISDNTNQYGTLDLGKNTGK